MELRHDACRNESRDRHYRWRESLPDEVDRLAIYDTCDRDLDQIISRHRLVQGGYPDGVRGANDTCAPTP